MSKLGKVKYMVSGSGSGAVFAVNCNRLYVLYQPPGGVDKWVLLPEVPTPEPGELQGCMCGGETNPTGHAYACPHYVAKPPSTQCQGCSDPLHRHGVPF